MTYKSDNARPMIVGQPVLVVIDVQKGSFMDWPSSERLATPPPPHPIAA